MPDFTDEQFQAWLESMRPFLENGASLYYAISQAGLLQHKTVIYAKSRLKDWFAEKIGRYQALPGELVNEAIVSLIRNILDKVKRKESITRDEQDMLKFFAEKSRSAQPFFVNRQENVQVKPIEEILNELSNDADSGHAELTNAAKQIVANNASIQDKGQVGQDSPVSPQSDPNIPPSTN